MRPSRAPRAPARPALHSPRTARPHARAHTLPHTQNKTTHTARCRGGVRRDTRPAGLHPSPRRRGHSARDQMSAPRWIPRAPDDGPLSDHRAPPSLLPAAAPSPSPAVGAGFGLGASKSTTRRVVRHENLDLSRLRSRSRASQASRRPALNVDPPRSASAAFCCSPRRKRIRSCRVGDVRACVSGVILRFALEGL